MKLVLKNGTEIKIDSCNRSNSFTAFEDGHGFPLKDRYATMSIFDTAKTLEELQAEIGDNVEGFVVKYGETEVKTITFDGWRIDSISEDISEEKRVIVIGLEETK